MAHLLIISGDAKTDLPLQTNLTKSGLENSAVSYDEALAEPSRLNPDIAIIEISSSGDGKEWQLLLQLKKQKNVPVIALVTEQTIANLEGHNEVDDFIICPYEEAELALRISRLLHKTRSPESADQIKADGLTLDLVTCDVTIDGIKVDLTFKEYELLKLMASSKGRVFTRQALLDKIWGYDYFGGDRTVDVHVRRLRSKIEDANHTYIETVRNIGYRFIKNV